MTLAEAVLPASLTLAASPSVSLEAHLIITATRFGAGNGPRTSMVEPVERSVFVVPA